jgi:hypothetical protein
VAVGPVARCVVLSLCQLTPTAAQIVPAGGEFQVNSTTILDQGLPAIASDADGDFVVVWWNGYFDRRGPLFPSSIQAQRYSADGTPRGGEFQVNASAANVHQPALASDAAGNFVVVWRDWVGTAYEFTSCSIRARRFDAQGSPLGGDFQVSSHTTLLQSAPDVESDAQGNFVVVWQSSGSSDGDTSGYSIQARQFDAGGSPLGAQFQVNTYTTSSQRFPAVGSDPEGNFVVVWSSDGSDGGDSSLRSIQGRRFAADGSPLGADFQVNTFTTNNQSSPATASDAQGNFVVVWDSNGSGGGDSSSYSVQARRFAADGMPLGEEFQVNSYTTHSQHRADVARGRQGNFLVSWSSGGSGGGDSSYNSVQARSFDSSGAPLGVDFQVNSFTTRSQSGAAIALDLRGDFVVAWQGYGSTGPDNSYLSVHAQRYVDLSCDLFCDGFGSGDMASWSASVP